MKNLTQKLAALVAQQQAIEQKIAQEREELSKAVGEIFMRALADSPALIAHPAVQQAYTAASGRNKKLVAAWLDTLKTPSSEATA